MYDCKENVNLENTYVSSILKAIPYGCFVCDREGKMIQINDKGKEQWEKYLNKDIHSNQSVYEILNKTITVTEEGELLVFSESQAYNSFLNGKPLKEVIFKFEVENIQRYISLNSEVIEQDGEIKGTIFICIDVTENYIAREKMRQERERFINISTELKTKCDIIEILRNREKEHLSHLKDVINNISEGLIVLDANGKFNFCNKAIYSILGMSPSEIVQGSLFLGKYEICDCDIAIDSFELMHQQYFVHLQPIKNYILKLKSKKEGVIKYIELNGNPIINKEKKCIYSILTLKDVTEIKLHEMKAEEQAEFIKDVVNTIDVPIVVVEYPQKRYKLFNKKFQEVMEQIFKADFNEEDWIGKSVRKVFPTAWNRKFEKLITYTGETCEEYVHSPYCVKGKDGAERFYKIKFNPYKDKNGQVTSIHIHGLDITEEINHNRELEQITRLKDEFFTIISHELRTPLTIIYSSLQLANNIYKLEITKNIEKTLGRIGQNCSRLLKLINNILDISKAEAGFLTINSSSFDIVYITETIITSVNLYAISKQIELIFDTNEEEAEVNLDRDKYEKILLNLLSNAIKFTPEGKRILVSLVIQEEGVVLSVKDEGIGIPKNKVKYIFDRFAQVNSSLSRRAEGTGLGLALVKKLVELMDGNIEVYTKQKKGTEFIVHFNKVCVQAPSVERYAMIDQGMNDKINIEFSDIN